MEIAILSKLCCLSTQVFWNSKQNAADLSPNSENPGIQKDARKFIYSEGTMNYPLIPKTSRWGKEGKLSCNGADC